jgi:hypothetical protein
MSEAYPRKRKNDDYYEPFVQLLLRWLGRALVFSFHYLVRVPLRWSWQATRWTLRQCGRVLAWAGRWTGRALAWTWRTSLLLLLQPLRGLGWLWQCGIELIFGRIPEFDTVREREIFLRIRRRFRRRNHFITHLIVFIVVSGSLWVEWLNRDLMFRGPLSARLGFIGMWAVVLLLHYIRLRMGEAEDAALEAALEREYQRQQPVYYEESEAYYGDYESFHDLTDMPAEDSFPLERAKAKRR